MARPPRLTNKIRENIYKGIRLGLTYDRAAQLAGITARTFYSWKAKGLANKAPIYVQFLHELKKAEIEGEAAAINQIVKAAQEGNWTAAAWMLERRFPERWARVQKVEVSWKTEMISAIKEGQLSFEEVMEVINDDDLARELFESAGIEVISGR